MRHVWLVLMLLCVGSAIVALALGGSLTKWEQYVWVSVAASQAVTIWMKRGAR
jgi:hypothetical protein